MLLQESYWYAYQTIPILTIIWCFPVSFPLILHIPIGGLWIFWVAPLSPRPHKSHLVNCPLLNQSWRVRNWAIGMGAWASCCFILIEILLRGLLTSGIQLKCIYLNCIGLWHEPSSPWGAVLPCSAGAFRQTHRDTGSQNRFLLTSQDRQWDPKA